MMRVLPALMHPGFISVKTKDAIVSSLSSIVKKEDSILEEESKVSLN